MLVLIFACATNGPSLRPNQSPSAVEQRFVGWLDVAGEFLLYDNLENLKLQKKTPHCISGVFAHQDPQNLRHLKGKKVEIVGSLHRFSALPWEGPPGTVLNRHLLGDSVVPNFCFGDEVILAKSIRLIR
jgi:hypothetical protein